MGVFLVLLGIVALLVNVPWLLIEVEETDNIPWALVCFMLAMSALAIVVSALAALIVL